MTSRFGMWTTVLVLAATGALAQTYPVRPVRLIVPTTPGGSVDTLARTIAPRLSERFGHQVVVDNRSGAGGTIAAEFTARSVPDGYTLMIGTIASLATNVSLQQKLSYDPLRDFAPVTLVATQNLVLTVHPSVPAKNVRELVKLAKARPGQLAFASAGNGTGSHLSGELFKQLAGVDVLHIPYKGVAPALVDVISGQVSMSFPSILTSLPQVQSGRLRALAVSGAQRSGAMPDLPTMMEAGVKDYESATWYGIVAPVATPPEIVNKLNAEIAAILKQPDTRERIARDGADPVGNTPQQFGAFMKSEIEKWRKVIRAAGIQPG